jgi:D-glycero-alpha-D-manno-heptose-7-phosphate kinase
MIANLDRIKHIGHETCSALEAGDTGRFAELMHEHWLHKKERSPGMSNEELNGWYDLAIENGALGGKLVGAGGGGFLLFYTREHTRLRQAMSAAGLTEVRFSFDHDGCALIVRD